jgi:hypothetical protein
MKSVAAFLAREKVILSIYILFSVVTSIQHIVGGPAKYNNFIIFRQSLFHLLAKTNLHVEYPKEYFDIFLYHPAFCIMFAPFSVVPAWAGLAMWLIFCSVVLFYAIRALPLRYSQKVFFWWYILIELNTSIHNEQTNPIIGALGLFTFAFLEKGKSKWAALFPVIAFCIKGYGVIFAALFLFYPKKGQYILYSLFWLAIMTVLPLPFSGTDHFFQLYKDWYTCLIEDHKVNFGFSIMGLIKVWRPSFTDDDVMLVQYAGVLLFALTWMQALIRRQYDTLSERILLLAYASLWVIMFNHAAESSTFVIAIQGVALWYIVSRDRLHPWARILVICVFFFSILAPTDVYPHSWRNEFFRPNLIKVIPCFLVWCVLQIQFFSFEKRPVISSANH